ncbi:hypothetical protein [Mannheimia haemolytica]
MVLNPMLRGWANYL